MRTGLQKKRRSSSLCQPFPLDGLALDRASDQPLHRQLFSQLDGLGIALDDVTALLETEGVQKFEDAWAQLLEGVQRQLDEAAKK